MNEENNRIEGDQGQAVSNGERARAAHPSLQPAGSLGLAITSLVLGILAVFLSFALLGSVLGMLGLILGLVYLRGQRGPKGMARWGVGLSVLGLVVSIGFAVLYYQGLKELRKSREAMGGGPSITEWQGVAAPDFTVTTLAGEQLTLSKLKGKRVVLDFWATWCPPCRMEIPHFIQLAKEISADELCIVGISSEDVETLQEFAKEEGINYPLATAENLLAPYLHVQSIPTTFFIDRNGVIQTILVGYHDLETLKGHILEKDWEGAPKPAPVPVSGDELPMAGA